MTGPKRSKYQINKDRHTVGELYLKGVYQSVIAEQLGLTQQQISYDLKMNQKTWAKNTALSLDEHKIKELAKNDNLERVAWADYERSKREFKSKIIRGKNLSKNEHGQTTGDSIEQTIKTEDRNGDPRFLDVIAKCIERRCKLLGLDEPQKHEHSGSQKSPLQIYLTMSEHERKAKLTQLLSRVQEGIQEGDCNEQDK